MQNGELLDVAEQEAIEGIRDMSYQALLKMYIGQGLWRDVAQFFGDEVLETTAHVLARHLQSEEEEDKNSKGAFSAPRRRIAAGVSSAAAYRTPVTRGGRRGLQVLASGAGEALPEVAPISLGRPGCAPRNAPSGRGADLRRMGSSHTGCPRPASGPARGTR